MRRNSHREPASTPDRRQEHYAHEMSLPQCREQIDGSTAEDEFKQVDTLPRGRAYCITSPPDTT